MPDLSPATPRLGSRFLIAALRRTARVAALLLVLSVLALACIARPCRPPRPSAATLGKCPTCHAPQDREHQRAKHRGKGVGCITCHGRSAKHAADKTGKAKPGRVFAKADIDDYCAGCHLDICPESQSKRRHTPPKTCALCHGAHTARIPPEPATRRPAH